MITNYSSLASTSALAQTSNLSKTSSADSTADILSSFKEIFSLMTMSSSTPASGQQGSFNMTDMMAPLMLMLLEKLVEQQVEPSAATTTGAATQAVDSAASTSKAEPSGRPVEGGFLTQEFHTGHTGIDIGVVVGTPVKTTMDGKVIHAGWNDQGYGNLVIVENGAYRTYYAHLSSIPVSVGDTVTAGSTIGLSGNTGHSTGPHLHYEIRKNKVPIDPAPVTLD